MANRVIFKQIFNAVALCLGCFFATGYQPAISVELESLSSNVFNFQMKLATNGNVQSQTKLGEMLETGNGVSQDMEQAKHWYQQAASNGYEPALNRLTYLEIKTTGYDKIKHASWVTSIKVQAQAQNRDSMLLLAQMYREGISVRKDLSAAKQLLEILSVSGNMSIDKETALLDAEIDNSQRREQQLAIQRNEAARVQQTQQAEKVQQAVVQEKAAAASAEETAEEKKKRYEAVMRKLQEEQRILKEQQSWAEDRK